VLATTMAVHIASRRVMEKAGLSLTRTFHQPWPYTIDGDEHGDVEYALTKADWESQEATEHGGTAETRTSEVS
jgi:RimJ/RimL family protein N-acetyltransferase